MNNSELLLEFLDGDLSPDQEDALFSALASNSELRREMKDHLAISSAIRDDVEAFTPPVESTRNIFSTLGFQAPVPPPPPAIPGGNPLLRYVLSALAGAVVTAVLFWFFFPVPGPQQQDFPASTRHDYRFTAPSLFMMAHHKLFRDQQTATPAHESKVTRLTSDFPPPSSTPDEKTIGQAMSPKPVAFSKDRTEKLSEQIDANTFNVNYDELEIEPVTERIEEIGFFDLTGSRRNTRMNLILMMRGSESRALPIGKLPAGANPWFNDIAIGAYYGLSSEHQVGVEIGYEAFGKKYTINGENGILERQSYPVLPWIGALYRYSMRNTAKFYPYGQVLFGGTRLGPLSKGIIGVSYSPDSRTTLSLGLEGSLLMYRNQSKWVSSSKAGITYGIAIRVLD
ncbi:MAG: hypothetical protein GXO82_10150 [Chlorobi bacterium]|nr:hypothetical protein [Chlorobiota bacterium]